MTDRPDEPLSSDELIRRAREGLGDTPTTPPPSDPPLPPTPAAPPPPEVSSPAADTPGPVDDGGLEPPSGDIPPLDPPPRDRPVFDRPTVEPTPPVPEWAEPQPPATDPPGTFIPENFEPSGAPAATAEPSLLQKLARNWRWIAAAVVGVIVVASFFDSSKPIDSLDVGECFAEPGTEEVGSVDVVDCAESHEYEVLSRIQLRGEDSAYPGDDALASTLFEDCVGPFFDYTGFSEQTYDFSYDIQVFYPTSDSWSNGDRLGLCTIAAVDANGFPVPTEGSARNVAE